MQARLKTRLSCPKGAASRWYLIRWWVWAMDWHRIVYNRLIHHGMIIMILSRIGNGKLYCLNSQRVEANEAFGNTVTVTVTWFRT